MREKLLEALRAIWIPLLAAALSAVAGGGVGITLGEGDRSNQEQLLQFVARELDYREHLLARCEGRSAWASRPEAAPEKPGEIEEEAPVGAPPPTELPSRKEIKPFIEDLPKPVQKIIRRAARRDP